jgi:hypothetical protein
LARSFGVQPIIGTVSRGSAPTARASSTKTSVLEPSGSAPGFALSSGMLKKNQSEARLLVSFTHE